MLIGIQVSNGKRKKKAQYEGKNKKRCETKAARPQVTHDKPEGEKTKIRVCSVGMSAILGPLLLLQHQRKRINEWLKKQTKKGKKNSMITTS